MVAVDNASPSHSDRNWGLVQLWLQKAYPLLFPEGDEAKPRVTHRKRSPWIAIFEDLVGDDIVNGDKYAMLPIHTVLKHLTKKIKQNAKQ